MSVSWYVVLENEVVGLDTAMSGKAMASHAALLESIARHKGVRSPMSFFAMRREELRSFAEAHGLEPDDMSQAEIWFSASEGLKMIDAVHEGLLGRGSDNQLIEDLENLRRILATAREHGVRWHLGVDF